jgi:hypothetical protein
MPIAPANRLVHDRDIRHGPLHSKPAVIIPATICIQPRAWACIRMRELEPDCAECAALKGAALADSLDARLKPLDGLQGAPVRRG